MKRSSHALKSCLGSLFCCFTRRSLVGKGRTFFLPSSPFSKPGSLCFPGPDSTTHVKVASSRIAFRDGRSHGPSTRSRLLDSIIIQSLAFPVFPPFWRFQRRLPSRLSSELHHTRCLPFPLARGVTHVGQRDERRGDGVEVRQGNRGRVFRMHAIGVHVRSFLRCSRVLPIVRAVRHARSSSFAFARGLGNRGNRLVGRRATHGDVAARGAHGADALRVPPTKREHVARGSGWR